MLGEYGRTTVLVDHKSTRGTKTVTIPRDDLHKNLHQADALNALPILTFGYKGKHDLYGIVPIDILLNLIESRERALDFWEEAHVQQ